MPDSLLEAAVIDGATMGTTFRKIVVPMAKNTTMTVLTYNFVFVWNGDRNIDPAYTDRVFYS